MSEDEAVLANGTGDSPLVKSEPTDITKASIRQKIWDYIEENELADFPRPVHNRIPNYKDSGAAAERLKDLDHFQNAKTVKINPDKPQAHARFLTMEAAKTLLVPTPRMREGLFNRVTPPAGAEKEVLRECCTFQGIKTHSSPVGTAEGYMVDLVVIGSVAVTETGVRIGKGEGFADLEYAIMSAAGAVDDSTIVVTTVHDCQITDIPDSLVQPHDLAVDYILTPTQVIKCSGGGDRERPKGVVWGMLTERKYLSIPILKELREKDEEAGIDTTLAPTPEGGEPRRRNRRPRRNQRQRRRRGPRREGEEGESPPAGDEEYRYEDRDNNRREVRDNNRVNRPRRQRIYRRRKPTDSDGEGNQSMREDRDGYRDGDRDGDRPAPRRRRPPPDCPPGCRIFVGGVTRRTRVSEFKTAIRAKGVNPRRVVWRGGRGFCFLEFEAPDRIDEDVGLLEEVIFNNVKLRPQIAIERGPRDQEDATTEESGNTDKVKEEVNGELIGSMKAMTVED